MARCGKGAPVYSKELMLTGASRYSAYSNRAFARAVKMLAFICFTSIGAQLAVRLPFTPVPVTMQTLFVILAGVTLGPRDGFYAMFSYIALGFAGVPVFAGFGFGPAALLGPTGGYLVSFPAAALVSGYISASLGSSRRAIGAASLCGMALILVSGASYLALISGLPFSRAALLGIAPFAAGELVKALMVSFISHRRTDLESVLG
jgi:biotin transport system substrate-specific component